MHEIQFLSPFNPIQDGLSRGCSRMGMEEGGGGCKNVPSLKSGTHILKCWNLA